MLTHLSFDSGDISLYSGVHYLLFYQVELNSFSGSPNILSHGDGFVQIAITPAPEPSTAALLAVASLSVRRGTRCAAQYGS